MAGGLDAELSAEQSRTASGLVREPAFGRIGLGHPCHERYRAYLKRTVEDAFARFLTA
jgi:hypothetical protein